MTSEPTITRSQLADVIHLNYGIEVSSLEFLPIGFDVRSVSYRCNCADGRVLYLKLRQVEADQESLILTSLEVASRVTGAIRPIPTLLGSQLSARFGSYVIALFPFVTGTDGWTHKLTSSQWRQVGETLRSLHDIEVTEVSLRSLPIETYSDHSRKAAMVLVQRSRSDPTADLTCENFYRLIREHQSLLVQLVEEASSLAGRLSSEPHELVCCHGDIHSGNFLISADGWVHPIDWDTLSLAPREKDLMFVGAGIGGMLDAYSGQSDFFEAYGRTEINLSALRYFRLERIVQDLVAYGEQIPNTLLAEHDRDMMLRQAANQFNHGNVIDVALRT